MPPSSQYLDSVQIFARIKVFVIQLNASLTRVVFSVIRRDKAFFPLNFVAIGQKLSKL